MSENALLFVPEILSQILGFLSDKHFLQAIWKFIYIDINSTIKSILTDSDYSFDIWNNRSISTTVYNNFIHDDDKLALSFIIENIFNNRKFKNNLPNIYFSFKTKQLMDFKPNPYHNYHRHRMNDEHDYINEMLIGRQEVDNYFKEIFLYKKSKNEKYCFPMNSNEINRYAERFIANFESVLPYLKRCNNLKFENIFFTDTQIRSLLLDCKMNSLQLVHCLFYFKEKEKITQQSVTELSISVLPTKDISDVVVICPNLDTCYLHVDLTVLGDTINAKKLTPSLLAKTLDENIAIMKRLIIYNDHTVEWNCEFDIVFKQLYELQVNMRKVTIKPELFPKITKLSVRFDDFIYKTCYLEITEVRLFDINNNKQQISDFILTFRTSFPNCKKLTVSDKICGLMLSARSCNDVFNIDEYILPDILEKERWLGLEDLTIICSKDANPIVLDALKREIVKYLPLTRIHFIQKREYKKLHHKDLNTFEMFDWKLFSERYLKGLVDTYDIIRKMEYAGFGFDLLSIYIGRYLLLISPIETLQNTIRLERNLTILQTECSSRKFYLNHLIKKREQQLEIYLSVSDTNEQKDPLVLKLRDSLRVIKYYVLLFDNENLELNLKGTDYKVIEKHLQIMEECVEEMILLCLRVYPNEKLFDRERWFDDDIVDWFDIPMGSDDELELDKEQDEMEDANWDEDVEFIIEE
ncbi:hypothetical protein ABK040_009612 [Willaertia magna]